MLDHLFYVRSSFTYMIHHSFRQTYLLYHEEYVLSTKSFLIQDFQNDMKKQTDLINLTSVCSFNVIQLLSLSS